MPFDPSVVKYIDVYTWNDYLELRHIMKKVGERVHEKRWFIYHGVLYWVECEMIINLSSLSEKWRGLANVC